MEDHKEASVGGRQRDGSGQEEGHRLLRDFFTGSILAFTLSEMEILLQGFAQK